MESEKTSAFQNNRHITCVYKRHDKQETNNHVRISRNLRSRLNDSFKTDYKCLFLLLFSRNGNENETIPKYALSKVIARPMLSF